MYLIQAKLLMKSGLIRTGKYTHQNTLHSVFNSISNPTEMLHFNPTHLTRKYKQDENV